MQYYEVSPTTIVRADADSFSYASHEELAPGTIVTIPVGKKVVVGVVLQISRHYPANCCHCTLG